VAVVSKGAKTKRTEKAMVAIFQEKITADDVKAKARELGADIVGIADSAAINANPPDPADPRVPADISDHDAGRTIVIGKRLSAGVTRITRWNERHKYYNDELTTTMLEEITLELVLWLESKGYPGLIVPPSHVDPWRYQGDPNEHMKPMLSLEHAGVEAGLGTLGLNRQLLTPEYGPRVMLAGVLSSVPVPADARQEESLCLGPECGRCLTACPGDVIQHWDRDWAACDRYRSPHGFAHLTEFLTKVMTSGDPNEQKAALRSEDSFNLWQSILRGAGVISGCRRCQDVCPVGADYETMLKDALDDIPEATDEKAARREAMQAAEAKGDLPEAYTGHARWIGTLGYLNK
jgi:epoxyqueuosine reductase